jgi:hypothetical protein
MHKVFSSNNLGKIDRNPRSNRGTLQRADEHQVSVEWFIHKYKTQFIPVANPLKVYFELAEQKYKPYVKVIRSSSSLSLAGISDADPWDSVRWGGKGSSKEGSKEIER